jgi:hypothetical protein
MHAPHHYLEGDLPERLFFVVSTDLGLSDAVTAMRMTAI